MDGFQKKVIAVAFVILIIILISTYYLLYKSSQDQTWPPSVNPCPDYFEYDLSKNGSYYCYNTRGLGTNAPAVSASSLSTNCLKYTYASQYQVPWDGITYGNGTNLCAT
jgi:hypothetical protein